MNRRLVIARAVQKDIDVLPDQIAQRVDKKIQNLAGNPFPVGCLKLVNAHNGYRVRVGDYRILYRVMDSVVEICSVAHRKDAYR
ncbi:MAG: type II toxin-antitoxin system RelE/ParE family toxin [bacterium]